MKTSNVIVGGGILDVPDIRAMMQGFGRMSIWQLINRIWLYFQLGFVAALKLYTHILCASRDSKQ